MIRPEGRVRRSRFSCAERRDGRFGEKGPAVPISSSTPSDDAGALCICVSATSDACACAPPWRRPASLRGVVTTASDERVRLHGVARHLHERGPRGGGEADAAGGRHQSGAALHQLRRGLHGHAGLPLLHGQLAGAHQVARAPGQVGRDGERLWHAQQRLVLGPHRAHGGVPVQDAVRGSRKEEPVVTAPPPPRALLLPAPLRDGPGRRLRAARRLLLNAVVGGDEASVPARTRDARANDRARLVVGRAFVTRHSQSASHALLAKCFSHALAQSASQSCTGR
eukprot:8090235-Pyramimonas_sp.AAC.1